ncbi:IS1096 element passenger TnpR family protein [Succinivibrio dextrinosolvens]|uniref:IS1096 element passenger TnpR family protein n=1 Tax=Succinivibrio dextrinosolvens TaxID=83771 RepID=UPI0019216962|nr:hypothetical protein [Succinivibrio dextrinosolvens]
MNNISKNGFELKVYPVGEAREVYRVFQIRGSATFEELCYEILDQFDFDYDHLYEFCMNNRPYSDENIQSAREAWSDRHDASVITLNDEGLVKGRKFLFHYDYGDDWMFNVTVAKVLDDFDSKYAITISTKGKLYQYGSDSDDDEDFFIEE